MFLDESPWVCGISRRMHEILYFGDCTKSPKTYLDGLHGFPYDKSSAVKNWASCEYWESTRTRGALGNKKRRVEEMKGVGKGLVGVQLGKSTLISRLQFCFDAHTDFFLQVLHEQIHLHKPRLGGG